MIKRSSNYDKDEFKEKLGLQMTLPPPPKVCSMKPLENYRALFTYIYIEHKGTIGLGSNGLTKAREKIEPWAHC